MLIMSMLLLVQSSPIDDSARMLSAVRAAISDYRGCVIAASKKLDDKRSSADVVVEGARSRCITERQLVELLLQQWIEDARQVTGPDTIRRSARQLLQRVDAELRPAAVAAVLENRKEH